MLRSTDLVADLKRLHNEFAVETMATVLDETATALEQVPRPPKMALVFGAEAPGLSRDIIEACTRRITIPMKLGTDSLNVSVAAGIFLYHFTRR